MPLARRLPKRGFRPRNRTEYAIINLGALEGVDAGVTIDLEFLQSQGLVKKGRDRLKVLAQGELQNTTVRAHKFSAAAAEKITAAGGTAEVIQG